MSHVQRRRTSVFGHIRRLLEQASSHADRRLAVDAHSSRKPDNDISGGTKRKTSQRVGPINRSRLGAVYRCCVEHRQ